MMPSLLLPILSPVPLAWAQSCPLQFDSRIPVDFALAGFDAANLTSSLRTITSSAKTSPLTSLSNFRWPARPSSTSTRFRSTDADPLESQTDPVPNDVSGQGQFHFGLPKKPTDTPEGGDITKEGTQEVGIDEGIFYGGIFQEDSKGGCISLSPWCILRSSIRSNKTVRKGGAYS